MAATAPHASAAEKIWGGATSAFWTVGNNWSNNTPPVAGDNLTFSPTIVGDVRATSNNFPAGTVFGKITFAEEHRNRLFHRRFFHPANQRHRRLGPGSFYHAGDYGGHKKARQPGQSFTSTRSAWCVSANVDLNGNFLQLGGAGFHTVRRHRDQYWKRVGVVFYPGSIDKTNAGTLFIPLPAPILMCQKKPTTSSPWVAFIIPSLSVDNGTVQVNENRVNDLIQQSVYFFMEPGTTLSGTGVVDSGLLQQW